MAEPALRNFTINFGPQHLGRAVTACCVWCWSLTAKSSRGSTRISACFTAATEKLIEHKTYLQAIPYSTGSTMSRHESEAAFCLRRRRLLGIAVATPRAN